MDGNYCYGLNDWKWLELAKKLLDKAEKTGNGLKRLETDKNNDGDAEESNGMALSQFCLGYI